MCKVCQIHVLQMNSYLKREKYFKKWVFKRHLKVVRDSECLILRGRAFHMVGAATLNDLHFWDCYDVLRVIINLLESVGCGIVSFMYNMHTSNLGALNSTQILKIAKLKHIFYFRIRCFPYCTIAKTETKNMYLTKSQKVVTKMLHRQFLI